MERENIFPINCPSYKQLGEKPTEEKSPVVAIIMRVGDTIRVKCPLIDKNERCAAGAKCPYIEKGY